MKKFLFLFAFLIMGSLLAQDSSDIFVFDISHSYEGLELLNPQKASENKGYNNQPSFISNYAVVYAGNNDGQTDIAEYNLNTKLNRWVNAATEGGEYSPQKLPSSNDLAAVRLDKNGKQRLYRYDGATGNSKVMMEDLQVAYFAFFNKHQILATVLNGEKMDLVMINLDTKSVDTLFQDSGRSLQRIPKTETLSYTLVNDAKGLDLYVLEMQSGESFFICELPYGVNDYVWINDTQIVVGNDNSLYMYDTLGEPEWNKVASLSHYNIQNIKRMAISPNGKKIALVGEQP